MRAGVAHEDARRVEIEEEEAAAAPGERAAQLHDLGLLELAGGEHEDQSHDRHHAGGEAVGAVKKVDGVLHTDQPEHADRRHQQPQLDQVPARQAEEPDLDAEAGDRQQRETNLDAQLHDRRHRPSVVDDEQAHRQP